MSLSHFQNVTSGKALARRALIQHLSYHIVVPLDLPDWQTRKEKGYSLENNIALKMTLHFSPESWISLILSNIGIPICASR
jgi:hypothetical protein